MALNLFSSRLTGREHAASKARSILKRASRSIVDRGRLSIVPSIRTRINGAANLPVFIVVKVVLHHRVGISVYQSGILLVVRWQIVFLFQIEQSK